MGLKSSLDIYAHGRNVIKSQAYAALQSGPGIQSVLTAWDKKEHGRKRRVIGQGFTETAVRGYEPIIQSQIKVFCEKLVEGDGIKGVSEGKGWSSPKNMAFWCE
jgi:cytochrome P450